MHLDFHFNVSRFVFQFLNLIKVTALINILHFITCLVTWDYFQSNNFRHKRFIAIYNSDYSVFDRRQPLSNVLVQDEILIRMTSNQFSSLAFLCRDFHVTTDFKENIIS